MLRIKQNMPARSQKRGKAPTPSVGKGLPGFRIERKPSCEGVGALDHQATPTAYNNSHYTYSDFKLTNDGYKAGCTLLCTLCPRCNLRVYRTPIGWMACNLCGWSVEPCL